MHEEAVRSILAKLQKGELSVKEAMQELRYRPFADMGTIKFDGQRSLRTGISEAIFAPGKTPDEIVRLVESAEDYPLFITRADSHIYEAVSTVADATYHERAKLIVVGEKAPSRSDGSIVVVSAGTADIAVAEEAAAVAAALGNTVETIYDVGAAGLHRLLAYKETLAAAQVIIVAAGMDGILPGVVASLFAAPVIALPTSVGYGTGTDGHAAMLTMLNSCSPGIAAVNIDNGFGAGVFAHKMLAQCRKE